jgi:chromosome segregation ATPase
MISATHLSKTAYPQPATPKEGEMHEDRSKEILNYVTALVREFGDFRKEVGDFRQETNSRLDLLETRVTVLQADVGELRRHSEVLDARVERLDARMERFDARMERFEGTLDDTRRSMRLLNHKFGAVSEEMAEMRADDRTLSKRIAGVEKKVGVTDDV